MRKKVAAVLLTASVLAWGLWCGGQYFNEARVIPKLLSDPPRSVTAYNRIPTAGRLPFFFPLNPLIFLIPLLAAAAAWKSARRARKWLVLTTAVGFGVCAVLVIHLAPLIGSISAGAERLPAAEVVALADAWRLGNRVRLAAEFFGFICSALALRAWSAEAPKGGEK